MTFLRDLHFQWQKFLESSDEKVVCQQRPQAFPVSAPLEHEHIICKNILSRCWVPSDHNIWQAAERRGSPDHEKSELCFQAEAVDMGLPFAFILFSPVSPRSPTTACSWWELNLARKTKFPVAPTVRQGFQCICQAGISHCAHPTEQSWLCCSSKHSPSFFTRLQLLYDSQMWSVQDSKMWDQGPATEGSWKPKRKRDTSPHPHHPFPSTPHEKTFFFFHSSGISLRLLEILQISTFCSSCSKAFCVTSGQKNIPYCHATFSSSSSFLHRPYPDRVLCWVLGWYHWCC